MSDLVGNPEDRFSRVAAHFESNEELLGKWLNYFFIGSEHPQLLIAQNINFSKKKNQGQLTSQLVERSSRKSNLFQKLLLSLLLSKLNKIRSQMKVLEY